MRAEPAPIDAADRWVSVTAYVATLASIALGPLAGLVLSALDGGLLR